MRPSVEGLEACEYRARSFRLIYSRNVGPLGMGDRIKLTKKDSPAGHEGYHRNAWWLLVTPKQACSKTMAEPGQCSCARNFYDRRAYNEYGAIRGPRPLSADVPEVWRVADVDYQAREGGSDKARGLYVRPMCDRIQRDHSPVGCCIPGELFSPVTPCFACFGNGWRR